MNDPENQNENSTENGNTSENTGAPDAGTQNAASVENQQETFTDEVEMLQEVEKELQARKGDKVTAEVSEALQHVQYAIRVLGGQAQG